MAEPKDPINEEGGLGYVAGDVSKHGKYYMSIKLGPYKRPKPFSPTEWKPVKTVYLPIPQELRDDTSGSFANEDLNTVGDLINGAFTGGAMSVGLRKGGDVISKVGSAVLGGAAGFAGRLTGNAKMGDLLNSAVSDMASDLFPGDKISSAIQQSTGLAPNPNPTVMFQGPMLRDFSFSWNFVPRNKTESENIQKIIKLLKRCSLPENYFSGQAAVLRYPYLAQVNFYPWDKDGTGDWGWSQNSIIKMKRCFMSSVNVNYAPANTPAFFEGTNLPVAIQISISFKEVEYMLSNDFGGTEGGGDPAAELGRWSAEGVASMLGISKDAPAASDQQAAEGN